MAKRRKGVDGVDKVVDLFPAGSHRMVERLLKRAMEREARQAGRSAKAATRQLARALGGGPGGGGGGRGQSLAAELAKALRQRGDVAGKASIRQKAPDTGGRPFHFAHSVVKKEDAPRAAGKSGAGRAPVASAATGGAGTKVGRAAAHMRYIEREVAVERTYGVDREARDVTVEPGSIDRGLDGDGRGPVMGRDGAGHVHATGASAGQGYIENPVKLANGENVVFSFGTIGDRFEDRVRFWEALEEAEAHPSARVQHRLIVELPHEASPAARFEIVQRFCRRFEDDGVPFWAALHAPGRGNDDRNFHAHVVYSERPARLMVDPERPQDGTKWDFEVVRAHKKASRNIVTSRPHRQDKLRAYNGRDFIRARRAGFSAIANEVLERDGVKDPRGAPVRYDARSYKDMGVEAVPMRSINRIVADKVKDGRLTVLDGDYTRRMIAAELQAAAARRQRDVLEMIALEDAIRATTEGRRVVDDPRLPRDMRVSPLASVSKPVLQAAGRRILAARHEALQVDVMERATVASLERVIAATSPATVAAAARARDPAVRAEAPSAEAARLLHAAAVEELASTKAEAAKARRSLRYKIGAAANAWRDLVGAPATTTTPAMRRVLREVDAREDGARRGPEAKTGLGRAAPGVARGAAPERSGAASARVTPAPPSGDRGPKRDGSAPTGMTSVAAANGLPTNADLQAISAQMSSWIGAVRDAAPDADGRMKALEAMVAAVVASHKAKVAEARAMGVVLDDARGCAAGRASADRTSAGGKAPAPAAPEAVAAPTAPGVPERGPTRSMPASRAQVVADASSGGVATSVPSADATGRSVGSTMPPTPAPVVGSPPSRGKPSRPAGKALTPPLGSAGAPIGDGAATAEHPTDDLRRRKAIEEEEARKKKRKAVLGRRNRGRTR